MDENKVEVPDTTELLSPDAGMETEARQGTEAAAAEKEPTAAAPEPAAEPKSDTETEHAAPGEKAGDDPTAAQQQAGEAGAANGAGPAAVDQVSQQLAQANRRLLEATARARASQLNVPPERVKYALLMAGISEIDPTAENAVELIGAKLEQVITDVPELAHAPNGTGAAGDHRRTATVPLDPFERGFSGK